MGAYTLVIGNKNYSSWSLRPWLAMKMAGQSFEEIVIPLRQQATTAEIARHSPAGKVPVLASWRRLRFGSRSPSSSTSPKRFPRRGSGPRTGRRARSPAPSRPRCTPASRRCVRTCR